LQKCFIYRKEILIKNEDNVGEWSQKGGKTPLYNIHQSKYKTKKALAY
jgi:hypothetical protein